MSSTTTTTSYDYSNLAVNGKTPTAVYANGTQVLRLFANGTDVIHKDITQTTYYEGTIQFYLQYKVVISRYDSSSDCDGNYSDGRADITITPVIVDSSGDIVEVSINKLTAIEKITLKIGTTDDTVDITSGTSTTTSITKRIDWTYNYGADALFQINNSTNWPFRVNITSTFDAAIGLYETGDYSVRVGSTAGSSIGSFNRNGTYYFYTPIGEADPSDEFIESWRDY